MEVFLEQHICYWIKRFLFSISIHKQIPNHGLAHLPERLLLFRHDYESQNILQLLNAVSDVTDETLIEIILNSSRKYFVEVNLTVYTPVATVTKSLL